MENELNDKSTRRVTLPLSADDLKSYFEDKNQTFVVSYKDSDLKDRMFLIYLSNLELSIEIDFTGTSDDDVVSLVSEYFNASHLVNCKTLIHISMQILFAMKATPLQLDGPLTLDQVKLFADKNINILARWIHFVDSSLIYAIYSIKSLQEVHKIQDVVEIVDDINYLGQNVVHLFSVPNFISNYFSGTPPQRLSFFKQQFTEYMFKGKSFYDFFQSKENDIHNLLIGLFSDPDVLPIIKKILDEPLELEDEEVSQPTE